MKAEYLKISDWQPKSLLRRNCYDLGSVFAMRRVDKKAFGTRVAQRMDELKMSQPALAKAVGMKQQGVNSIVSGQVSRPRLLREIATALRTTEQWLLWKEGPKESPGKEADDPDVLPQPSGIVEIDIRAGMGGGGLSTHEIRKDGRHADPVKADGWHFPMSFIREELRAPADRLAILETQGDSMLPTISPGERVVVDTGHRLPTPDGIYAIRDRWGTMIVKRIQVLRKGNTPRMLIISDNESHSDEEVGADEIEIVGRVICALKRL